MNNVVKKILSIVLSAVMAVSSMTVIGFTPVMAAGTDVTIYACEGVQEAAYIEWAAVSGTDHYYVSYAKRASNDFTQIDDELIRQYPDRWRADLVGLAAGDYTVKVTCKDAGGSVIAEAAQDCTVTAHDRSGFAFSKNSPTGGAASGAYNSDGTIKSNAQILYVTKDTAKTVTAELVTNKNGTKETFTGLQTILDGMQSNGRYEQTPIDIRIIGTISKSDLDHISSSAEGLQVKGRSEYSNMNLTIEGIGKDAVIKDFGILIRNCSNVELRNFAVMNCMDDCISMDTNNSNLWVHNLDLFYGSTGGDTDQAKGDGTLDTKKTDYVTMSYNHLWDSGKASLCGMGDTEEAHITYHHNWFDHSDSRHPRVRVHSVHVYNNYYSGISKYGAGAAKGSSIFVENNYFDNCKYPMLISMQGSDVYDPSKGTYDGKGTFSSENGGMIKAYGNIIQNIQNGGRYVPYDANDATYSVQFDAYEVSSRDEKVPSSVTTLKGGTPYNNFDTDPSYDLAVDPSDIDAAEDVPSIVMASAGRVQGGDFPADRNKYVGLTDPSSSDVDTVLKADMLSYESSLVSIGGASDGSGPVDTTTTTTTITTTEATTEAPTETTTVVTETTTEATTAVTESSSEATTEYEPDPAPSDKVYGDVDGNGKLEINDASALIDMVLKGAVEAEDGITDVTGDGKADTADIATILQKILDSSWKMPCEPADEDTTESTTAENISESTTEEPTEGTTSEPAPAGSYAHNFTADGTNSSFFTISGNLSTDKGTVEYNGMTFTQCLKMETATSIKFNAPSAGKLTLVFSSTEGKKNCKVDGEKMDSDANGVLTVDLAAGAHEITKRDNSNLFYMVFTPNA